MNQILPFTCPNRHEGETEQDCPWAGIARELCAVVQQGGDVEQVLASRAPRIIRDVEADGARPGLMSIWGRSYNFDENVKAEIVEPALLVALNAWARLPRNHFAAHAGLLHTYGYLFSLLRTPYGFKRRRWVDGAISRGLGLPPALLSPAPLRGTLLLNVTCLAGSIAFRAHPVEHSSLGDIVKDAPGELWIPATLGSHRVLEHIFGERSDEIYLQTDLIPFSQETGTGETHLLIYSTWTSHGGRLMTSFPVGEEAAKALLAPKRMGDEVEIRVQYNGYVEGLSDRGQSFRGRRWLV